MAEGIRHNDGTMQRRPNYFVFGQLGTGNDVAKGRCNEGFELIDSGSNMVMKETDGCDCLKKKKKTCMRLPARNDPLCQEALDELPWLCEWLQWPSGRPGAGPARTGEAQPPPVSWH